MGAERFRIERHEQGALAHADCLGDCRHLETGASVVFADVRSCPIVDVVMELRIESAGAITEGDCYQFGEIARKVHEFLLWHFGSTQHIDVGLDYAA